jgi:hypothetical protein
LSPPRSLLSSFQLNENGESGSILDIDLGKIEHFHTSRIMRSRIESDLKKLNGHRKWADGGRWPELASSHPSDSVVKGVSKSFFERTLKETEHS